MLEAKSANKRVRVTLNDRPFFLLDRLKRYIMAIGVA